MSAERWTPGLALAAYAESWITGAKVIVFGSATSKLPERLLERGARLVHVYDRDAERVAEATALPHPRQLSYTAFEPGSPGAAATQQRDGVFDFGFIEDLTELGGAAQPWLDALARALSKRGMGLIASRNPDVTQTLSGSFDDEPAGAGAPLGYYELFERVNEQFSEVRMLGQTAFVGYAIADFAAEDDAEVRIDTAFLPNGAEEPEWFLALVSRLPITAEAFSVIQVPLAELSSERRQQRTAPAEASADSGARAAVTALEAELGKREEWLAALESRASTADQRADEMQSELDQLGEENTRLKRELEQLRAKAGDGARIEKLEKDRSERDKLERDKLERDKLERDKLERDKLDKAIKKAEERAQSLERERDALLAEKTERGRAHSELQARANELEQRAAQLTRELRDKEQKLSERAREAEQNERGELDALEAQLRERGAEVARLEAALHETERFGRQLISELNRYKTAADQNHEARQLAELARRNAELQADLEAARWTISGLEASLEAKDGDEATQPRARGLADPDGSLSRPLE